MEPADRLSLLALSGEDLKLASSIVAHAIECGRWGSAMPKDVRAAALLCQQALDRLKEVDADSR